MIDKNIAGKQHFVLSSVTVDVLAERTTTFPFADRTLLQRQLL